METHARYSCLLSTFIELNINYKITIKLNHNTMLMTLKLHNTTP